MVLLTDAPVGIVLGGGCCKNNLRQQFKDKLSYKINEVYQTIISLFLSHDFKTLEIMA